MVAFKVLNVFKLHPPPPPYRIYESGSIGAPQETSDTINGEHTFGNKAAREEETSGTSYNSDQSSNYPVSSDEGTGCRDSKDLYESGSIGAPQETPDTINGEHIFGNKAAKEEETCGTSYNSDQSSNYPVSSDEGQDVRKILSTSEIENFQNLILMYASIRHCYSQLVYSAKNRLAALDHNAHAEREVMKNKDDSLRFV
ncbi:Hypothetical predicted protein [Mytilus galloprovincialis]|uniref:Uncharacterized protein n=1 Tax=Mytilus galloprovincialis TaxID=29158 RepID=A0A8B6DUN8_MYTGA|nr:Hypothetical predicted protein [Mytilus galloprovincialis]